MIYEYRGINRRGGHVAGSTSETPSVFIETKYAAGWRELEVTERGESDICGEIYRSFDTGYRTWWASDPVAGEGMKWLNAVLAVLLLAAGLTVAVSPTAADAVSCTIPGATVEPWGCGTVYGNQWTGRTVALQDLATDGCPVRVRVKRNGLWSFTSIGHGSTAVGWYSIPSDSTGVRIYQCWNLDYVTVL